MNRREALAALIALPASTRLSVARLEQNDAIVVECDEPLSTYNCENIKATLEGVWPGRKIVICPRGIRLKFATELGMEGKG